MKLSTGAGYTSQRVDGFASERIRSFDVTDAREVRELTGAIEPTGDGRFAITVNAQLADRTLLALTAAQFKHPVSITVNRPSFLASKDNQADLVIITRREWYDALEPLKALRQKQGLRTMLVDVEDIFDEFSFGQKTPYAIRDFLRYATLNWKSYPRWLLLAGDASFDPRRYAGLSDTDFIPTKLTDMAYMETASDDWLADFNDDALPEMSVGRLPIRSSGEAVAMVNKVLGYERASPLDDVVLVADLNDGFDFESTSSGLRELLPSTLKVREIFRGRDGDETAKTNLIDAINRSQPMINYAGYGSASNWRANLLTTEDAGSLRNSGRLPFFVMMTCLNGYFQDPMNDSLAEALMRNPTGGAIAVWASSGITFPNEQTRINHQLYRTMFGGADLTLGEHVRLAKLVTSDPDVRRSWILFGDPTLRVK